MAPDRREHLRQETGRALGRLGELRRELADRRGEPPRPGDLYVLPETADYPVEWLVLEEEGGGAGWLLVVPADTHPLAGSGDVEVPAKEAGGPLSLRCRHGERVSSGLLARGQRTGRLGEVALERVRAKRRALEAGEGAVGTVLEREVDEELEYQDWIDDVVAPAREVLARQKVAPLRRDRGPAGGQPPAGEASTGPGPSRPGPARFSPFRPAPALAALFLLATVGLSLWVATLRREVEQLSRPTLDTVVKTLEFGDETRGIEEVRLSGSARYLVLHLLLTDELGDYQEYRLQVADRRGAPLWQSEVLTLGVVAEYSLVLSRRFLPPDEIRLRLYGLVEGGAELVEEEVLFLDTALEP